MDPSKLGFFLESHADKIPGLTDLLANGAADSAPNGRPRLHWSCKKSSTGQSNPTFFVRAAAAPGQRALSLVVRKQPSASAISAGQHRMDREFRVQRALGQRTAVPVPTVHLYCADAQLLDGTFYVMEMCAGHFMPDPTMPALRPAQRRACQLAAVRTLAQLHSVDWAASALLGDYGAAGNYVRRQVKTMIRISRHQAQLVGPLPGLDALGQQFLQLAPVDQVSLLHGDYKLDNLIASVSGDQVDIRAVLDWELSTVGHPMADLAMFLLPYHTEFDASNTRGLLQGYRGLDLAAHGLASEQELLRHYSSVRCESATTVDSRRHASPDSAAFLYWIALIRWRYAVIFQGIQARFKLGVASDQSLKSSSSSSKTGNDHPMSAMFQPEALNQLMSEIGDQLRKVRMHVRPLTPLSVLASGKLRLSLDDDYGHRGSPVESALFAFYDRPALDDNRLAVPHRAGLVSLQNDYVRGIVRVAVHLTGFTLVPLSFHSCAPLNPFGAVFAWQFESQGASARVRWAGRSVQLRVDHEPVLHIDLLFSAVSPFATLPTTLDGDVFSTAAAHQACSVQGTLALPALAQPLTFEGRGHRFRQWLSRDDQPSPSSPALPPVPSFQLGEGWSSPVGAAPLSKVPSTVLLMSNCAFVAQSPEHGSLITGPRAVTSSSAVEFRFTVDQQAEQQFVGQFLVPFNPDALAQQHAKL